MAAIGDAVARLRRTEDVKNVVSPLTGGAPISADKHSVLVDFEVTGAGLEHADALGRRPVLRCVNDVPELQS
jgi:hypothetical protein